MDDVSSDGSSAQFLYSPSFITGVKDGDDRTNEEEEAIFCDGHIVSHVHLNRGSETVKVVSSFKTRTITQLNNGHTQSCLEVH